MSVMQEARPPRNRRQRQPVDPNGVIPADPLNRQELARDYGYALQLIYSVPELRDIFERAFSAKKGQWTPQRFQAAIQDSDWYRTNDVYFRNAWAQETVGGKDWETRVATAKEAVKRRAAQIGVSLTGPELDAMARRYLYEGWDESSRADLMDTALSQEISYLPDERGRSGFTGQAGNLVDQLRELAMANGVRYSDDWYQSEARSVAAGLKTADDSARDIQELAASRWQPWADRIRAGQTAYELASPYINRMADILELNPASITLDDPYISRAAMGANGQAMPLWDFEQQLRKDPRWLNTSRAQNDITGIASSIMKMFGLRG